ncbi:hypothetical protein ABZ234_08270 [Nocardiopsis sp. NPDC006198]|uniref:hypothetical protein n=1 Tax=Nocardiopsis sp. NPDC006198 TaxID=3154472 RepID=UPI0033AF42A5
MPTAPSTSPAVEAILRATTRSALKTVPTASALTAAAALLDDLWAAGARHGVDPCELDLASHVVDAMTRAYRHQKPVEVDPVALVEAAARATAHEVGQVLADLVVEDVVGRSPDCAYIVLARQEQTPAWGTTGTAPLVVRLEREDWGPGWEWVLFPDVSGGAGVVATVIAPPPNLEVAAEVGQIVARALTGKL